MVKTSRNVASTRLYGLATISCLLLSVPLVQIADGQPKPVEPAEKAAPETKRDPVRFSPELMSQTEHDEEMAATVHRLKLLKTLKESRREFEEDEQDLAILTRRIAKLKALREAVNGMAKNDREMVSMLNLIAENDEQRELLLSLMSQPTLKPRVGIPGEVGRPRPMPIPFVVLVARIVGSSGEPAAILELLDAPDSNLGPLDDRPDPQNGPANAGRLPGGRRRIQVSVGDEFTARSRNEPEPVQLRVVAITPQKVELAVLVNGLELQPESRKLILR